MATKKERREVETKTKKLKKGKRIAILAVIGGAFFGFLVFFFVSIFSILFPPIDIESGKRASKEKIEVVLFFSDENELFLVPEKRYVFKEKNIPAQAKEIVSALINGSKLGNVNTFPEKARVKDVKLDADQTAHVNFDHDFLKNHTGGTTGEIATIYSLTNSLIHNLPSIQRVKIMVDGKAIPSIKGHVSTQGAFAMEKERIIEGARNR
ncbi:MAG: GerMN domain-containing protein [Syntrophobacterales bacterium]|jgi:acyl-CoA synthetase (AMP-forming)/AMP-acid ligase II|nr:GerMN domain-containing protein [Syntrophobacterales bacterium]